MQSFEDSRIIEKQKQLKKATVAYLFLGIPVILFFTISDSTVVGIDGTLFWRVIGLLPMVIAIIVYLKAHFGHVLVGYNPSRWLLTAMITGVASMMAAVFYIVLLSEPAVESIVLAGTIAGNLLFIFTIGTLRGLTPLWVSISLTLPYVIMIIAFLISGELTAILWVFTINVIVAIPIVLVIIRQQEQLDNARLQALFYLEEERENLEGTVNERTRKLEVLLKELHHRVRNNLQIILSMINLYENHYSSLAAADKRLTMLQKAVQMMSEAHSLSYKDHIIEKINMRLFFTEICSDFSEENDYAVEYRIEDMMLNLETAVVIGFICIHLIQGAGTSCSVSMTSDKNRAMLSVSADTGSWNSFDDYNFAILLSETISAEVETVTIDNKTVARLSIPISV
ncbi:MAG: sensor histidine kinase [Spirochaetales bacterium]|nr:sensor histidine kinase [Spirochaetales bacterium]